jgi:hypothetical protein
MGDQVIPDLDSTSYTALRLASFNRSPNVYAMTDIPVTATFYP